VLNRYINALVGYFIFSASRATTTYIEDVIAAFNEVELTGYEEERMY